LWSSLLSAVDRIELLSFPYFKIVNRGSLITVSKAKEGQEDENKAQKANIKDRLSAVD